MLLSSMLICLGASSLFSAQQVVHVESSIDRVTVYPGFALVERVVEIPAQQKHHDFIVAVSPLPLSSQPSSFQTQVLNESVAVQGLELRSRMSTVANMAQANELETELVLLREQMVNAVAAKAGIKLQMDALRNMAYHENTSSSANRGLPEGTSERLEFLGKQMASYDVNLRTNQLLIDGLSGEIKDIDLQINGARNDRGYRIREARIHCFAQLLDTPSQIRLTYLVSGASWQPAYDVRISPDLTGVNVNSMGQVQQRTGEDWNQVKLVLSTSMPQIGLNPPDVPLRFVESNFYPPRRPGALSALSYVEEVALEGMSVGDDLMMGKSEGLYTAPMAEAIDYGITTQFLMPGKVDVAKNNEVHRFSIRTIPLEVEPERYIVPSQSEFAYLRAEVKHTGDSVLLAGTAKIFLGPDYLGESSFPLLRENDSTILNLGIDPNLDVDYVTIEDFRDDPGSFSLSSTSTITRRYSSNLRLSPAAQSKITVVVEEGMPRSNSDGIEVEIGELVPSVIDTDEAVAKQVEQGLYRWSFVLHPGETKKVRWGYELSFDEDSAPWVRQQ
jgi:uncharacterized protein (TIGR02231 family)